MTELSSAFSMRKSEAYHEVARLLPAKYQLPEDRDTRLYFAAWLLYGGMFDDART